MKFPKGTKFNEWRLRKEIQKGVERFVVYRTARLPDGSSKFDRLPVSKYQQWRDDELELRQMIKRLNSQIPPEQRAKEAVELKHAFISPELLDKYREFLLVQIPSKKKAGTEYSYLFDYFLTYFIAKKNISDPLQWHAIHKTEWAKFLLSKDAPKSGSVKRNIVAAANRFMTWLHDERPAEVPPLKFQPLSKAKIKEVEANREMRGEVHKPKMIKDEHWEKILKDCPANLRPFLELAWKYGLRRAETLGLKLEDVRKGYLSVERQVKAYTNGKPVYAPLKGREKRQVPHWFGNPTDAHKLIKAAQDHLCHPDTLGDRWEEWIRDTDSKMRKRFDFEYWFHDIRHTWITKALRGRDHRDVQLAAGHKNITTTMGYAHDDRNMDDDVFVPEAS